MKDILTLFGASITAQKDGYAKRLSDKFVDSETHVFGYGGNHLDDAGICFLDTIVKTNCNYCFLDFFATAYTSISDRTIECLDTIVHTLTKSNCKLVFLFMVREDHAKRIDFYNFLKRYITSKHLYSIDLNDSITYTPELFRDTCHTTPLGSETYANHIYDVFQKEKVNISYPCDIVKTKYCDGIHVLQVHNTFHKKVVLEGNCFIVAMYLQIGPKSGIVEIGTKKYWIWDRHCHYTRSQFGLRNIEVRGEVTLYISQETIDYSTCARPVLDTNVQKELNILQIYYIGDSLQITSSDHPTG